MKEEGVYEVRAPCHMTLFGTAHRRPVERTEEDGG